jgi:hypothetical protein
MTVARLYVEGDTRRDATGGTQVFQDGRWRSREVAEERGWTPTTKPAARSRFTAADLWDMNFPPVQWVVPELISAGLTLLAGKPKLGKSWLALDVLRAVAEGGFCLGNRHCPQGAVLYVVPDDPSPRRMKDRLRKVCPKNPGPALSVWMECSTVDRGLVDDLRLWIEAAENPRLIVIDTLRFIRPERKRDEAPYEHDYRTVKPLKELADEYGLAIVLVHHTRKQESDDALESVSGTNGLTGAADATIILGRNGEGAYLAGRGRDVAEFEMAVRFDHDTFRWSVLGDASEVRRSDERRKIIEALRGATAPMTSREIADVTDQPDGNVRRLLAKMYAAGEVTKPERGRYVLSPIPPGNKGNNGNKPDGAEGDL